MASLVTVIGFGIAARRFHWLSKLIRSGKKDPNRTRGPLSRKVEAETVEVAGQRKLLQWTVPGLAHFFTMWGFTILLLTIIEAYGDLFDKYFHIPRHRDLGLGRLHRGLLHRAPS